VSASADSPPSSPRAAAAAASAASAGHDDWACWTELSPQWSPPARLGLSLVATEEGRVFAFGGLAIAGAIRLRSQDAFTLDLRASPPTWRYVTGSQLPAGIAAAGTPPPPRLEQVAGALIGGRVLVFGGSMIGAGARDGAAAAGPGGAPGGDPGSAAASARSWEPYVMSPNSETPTWRRLRVRGAAPRDAWGYSSCMLGTTRFVLLGRYENDTLDLNELHELSVLSVGAGDGFEAADSAGTRGSGAGKQDVYLPCRSASSFEEEEEEVDDDGADGGVAPNLAAAAAHAAAHAAAEDSGGPLTRTCAASRRTALLASSAAQKAPPPVQGAAMTSGRRVHRESSRKQLQRCPWRRCCCSCRRRRQEGHPPQQVSPTRWPPCSIRCCR
jgi:hypothetical protein